MGFDTWLEQDIRSFLDARMTEERTPQVTRLEDAESIYANKDWKKEIDTRLQQSDVPGAKQLFAQLRLKYLGTPKDHEAERASLYATMQECYVLIANHVLTDWHAKEMLRRMDTGSENIFDSTVKPVDITATHQRIGDALPDVPQFTRSTIQHAEPLKNLKDGNDLDLPASDKDPFSFEPQDLIHVANQANATVKHEERVAAGIERPAEQPPIDPFVVAKLAEALTLVKSDPKKAVSILETLTEAPMPSAITEPAKKLLDGLKQYLPQNATKTTLTERAQEPVKPTTSGAPLGPVPTGPSPSRTETSSNNGPKPSTSPAGPGVPDTEPVLVGRLVYATDIAKTEPRRALEILESLMSPTTSDTIRSPATKLHDGIKRYLDTQETYRRDTREERVSPRIAALRKARLAATTYERTARLVHDEMARAAAYARARDLTRADEAMAIANGIVDTFEKDYPGAAKQLRERMEWTARVVIHHDLAKNATKHSKAYYEVIEAIRSVKRSASAHNRKAFTAAVARLEAAADQIPLSHRALISDALATLRSRATVHPQRLRPHARHG